MPARCYTRRGLGNTFQGALFAKFSKAEQDSSALRAEIKVGRSHLEPKSIYICIYIQYTNIYIYL